MDDTNNGKITDYDYLFSPKPTTPPLEKLGDYSSLFSQKPAAPPAPNITDSDDADKKYQEILNKYASEISSNEIIPEINPPVKNEVVEETRPEPEPEPSAPLSPPLPPIKNDPVPAPEAPVLDPVPAESVVKTSPPPAKTSIFKYLFLLSVIVFLCIVGGLVYTVYKINNLKSAIGVNNPITPAAVTSPVITTGPGCDLNDTHYAFGESFKTADGCNTCTCGESSTIDCTQKECDSSQTSSTSAIPKNWKSYSNDAMNFSLNYPQTYSIKTIVGSVSFCPPKTDATPCLVVSQESVNPVDSNTSVIKESTSLNGMTATKSTLDDLINYYFADSKLNLKYSRTSSDQNLILSSFKNISSPTEFKITSYNPSSEKIVQNSLAYLEVKLSQSVDPKSVTSENVYVLDGIDTKLPGKVSVNQKTNTIRFTFSTPVTNTNKNADRRISVVLKNITSLSGIVLKDTVYNLDIH